MADFVCHNCKLKRRVSDSWLAKSVKCPKCKSSVAVVISPSPPSAKSNPSQPAESSTPELPPINVPRPARPVSRHSKLTKLAAVGFPAISTLILGYFIGHQFAETELPDHSAKTIDQPTSEKVVTVEEIVIRKVDALEKVDVSQIKNGRLIASREMKFRKGQVRSIKFSKEPESLRHMSAVVLIDNISEKKYSPKIHVAVFNKYGIKIGFADSIWLTYIQPGERKQDKIEFRSAEDGELFKFSPLAPIEGFYKPYALTFEDKPL